MKIAHLIMAYKNPIQLERLVQRLIHPNFHIYIHLDKKVDIQKFRAIEKYEHVFFIEDRVVCNWGGFSLVKAITSSIREVLDGPHEYGYLNLLSAQDYPLKSNAYIYNYLQKNNGKSFISFEPSNASSWWKHAVTRYENFHFTDINIRGRYLVQAALNKIIPKRRFPLDCQLYGSSVSTWWTMTSECARYVESFLMNNPKLLRFMKFTWAADEFLYATIIMNSKFSESAVNNNLRYIEWEPGKPNPRIFTTEDFDSLKVSSQLFARKFDIGIDEEILDRLDQLIDQVEDIKTGSLR